MARILVIEDERHISRLIEVNLDRVGSGISSRKHTMGWRGSRRSIPSNQT